MKIFSRFPVFRFVLPLFTGICLYLADGLFRPSTFLIAAVSGYMVASWFTRKQWATGKYAQRWLAGIPFYFCFASLGFLEAYVQDTSQFTNHYATGSEPQEFLVEANCAGTATPKGTRVPVRVMAMRQCSGWQAVRGNLLLFIGDTAHGIVVGTDDRFLILADPRRIPGASLPGGYDPALHYAGIGCFFQAFVPPEKAVCISRGSLATPFVAAGALRNRMLAIISTYIPEPSARGVTSALLLGYEDWLDPELETSYNGAGVLHILCVSGMHVMLVYVILAWLLSWMDKYRGLRPLKYFLLLAWIWFYAMLTGFSPSVLRAAAMVSFVIGGNWMGRNAPIYNLLCASCLLLCCLNVRLLQSAGFQLSFLAVCGIVFIHPYIRRWFQPRNKLISKTWELISVSLSAQLATMPISLWMFHQFPNYFLLANLVLVPLSTLAMYSGMALLASSWIPFAGTVFGWTTFTLVTGLNRTVSFISNLPGALTTGVFISLPGMLLLYAILTNLVLWFLYKHSILMRIALVCIILFLADRIASEAIAGSQAKTVVVAGRHFPDVFLISGHQAVILRASDQGQSFGTKSMDQYLIRIGVTDTAVMAVSLPGCYQWQNRLLLVNQWRHGIVMPPSIWSDPPVMLIMGFTSEEADKIIATLKPGNVIIDRSVQPTKAHEIEVGFRRKGIPVTKLKRDQAFITDMGLQRQLR